MAASEDYSRELARLFRARLNPSLRIFLEHGNEVWNPLCRNCYDFNRAAALADSRTAGNPIADDGDVRPEILSVRRQLRRTVRAVQIFAGQFGREEVHRRIFGVFSWWTIQPSQCRNALAWRRRAYGEPDEWIYGLAHTHYFNIQGASNTASPEESLAILRRSIDGFSRWDSQLDEIAREFRIRRLVYEGGPDTGGGSTVNVASRIEAHRLPGMAELVLYDIRDNFFEKSGDIYSYCSHCGPCSRYGCWGATEDIASLDTSTMQALMTLAGPQPEPRPELFWNPVRFDTRIAPGSLVVVRGENLAAGGFHWTEGSLTGMDLPAVLGGVQVQVNGITAPVLAAPDSVWFAVPPTVATGSVSLEVFTRNGTIRQEMQMDAAAPGVVASVRQGRLYAEADAGGARITPTRPALPGEEISVALSGLPLSADAMPELTALPEPVPLAIPTAFRVQIGGAQAEVLRLEASFPALVRAVIGIPEGLPAGDHPLRAEFEGVRSPAVWLPVGKGGRQP